MNPFPVYPKTEFKLPRLCVSKWCCVNSKLNKCSSACLPFLIPFSEFFNFWSGLGALIADYASLGVQRAHPVPSFYHIGPNSTTIAGF